MTTSLPTAGAGVAAPASIPALAPAPVPTRRLLAGLAGPCVRGALFVALVTGVAYPLATTGVAQLVWPHQAGGSLIERGGAPVGSALIGQPFAGAGYFHPRPSATTAPDAADPAKSVAAPYNGAASAGSNQGPTNRALVEAVASRVAAYRAANGLSAGAAVPVDAVTASASGLDPHISVANARLQAARVARERGIDAARMDALLARHTESRVLGLLGEPRVNVLRLNLALDELAPPQSEANRPAARASAAPAAIK